MGGPGSFDVQFNGEQIFSKKRSGRMPGEGEIIRLLQVRSS
jgi:hypothetical protein